jgi:hypothetical protein
MLILYASYVCLLHSRFVENHPIWILEDGPLISEVVLSQWWLMRDLVMRWWRRWLVRDLVQRSFLSLLLLMENIKGVL